MKTSLDEAVLEVISNNKIRNHKELKDTLFSQHNLQANQATLSRKLNKYSITKQHGFYQTSRNIYFNTRIIEVITSSPNIVIIHTSPGHANAVAYGIDQALRTENHPSKLDLYLRGTIAGDDTVMIVTDGITDLELIKSHLNIFLEKTLV